MLAEGLKSFSDIGLTVVGMVLFFLVFSGVFVKTYFLGRGRQAQQDAAMLPLQDEEAFHG